MASELNGIIVAAKKEAKNKPTYPTSNINNLGFNEKQTINNEL